MTEDFQKQAKPDQLSGLDHAVEITETQLLAKKEKSKEDGKPENGDSEDDDDDSDGENKETKAYSKQQKSGKQAGSPAATNEKRLSKKDESDKGKKASPAAKSGHINIPQPDTCTALSPSPLEQQLMEVILKDSAESKVAERSSAITEKQHPEISVEYDGKPEENVKTATEPSTEEVGAKSVETAKEPTLKEIASYVDEPEVDLETANEPTLEEKATALALESDGKPEKDVTTGKSPTPEMLKKVQNTLLSRHLLKEQTSGQHDEPEKNVKTAQKPIIEETAGCYAEPDNDVDTAVELSLQENVSVLKGNEKPEEDVRTARSPSQGMLDKIQHLQKISNKSSSTGFKTSSTDVSI